MPRERIADEHSILVVSGSRTIPTKPYGNEKWELSVTREGADLQEDINLIDMCNLITELLDTLEVNAIGHANQS